MYALLEDHDVIVAQTRLDNDNIDIRVMFVEDEEVFYTVWKRKEGAHQVMWRGNLEGCMKEYTDIVADVVMDWLKNQKLIG